MSEHVQVTGENDDMFHYEKLLRLVKKNSQAQRALEGYLKNWEGTNFLPNYPKPQDRGADVVTFPEVSHIDPNRFLPVSFKPFLTIPSEIPSREPILR